MIKNFLEMNNASDVGNKAASLIELRKEGFPVPDGFVIDKDTYLEIIRTNQIEDAINTLLRQLTIENLTTTSKAICSLFEGLTIPSSIKEEIYGKLSADKSYAVRSSGTKEDMETHSFAGQYETFLNVTAESVIDKMLLCYQSMFSEVILSYFLNNHISFSNMAMSVIVQEMADAEYSGICFTLNPLTGNDTEMLIEVGEGLGENIVSGKVAPEQYYFDWYQESFHFDPKNRFLDSKLLTDMTRLFLEIQLHFGYPCDIEFAICQNSVQILQARKITKIKYQEITDIWSTADFKDGGVSATTCKPYMWSLYEYIWEHSLRKFILDSKILPAKDLEKKLGDMFYGRCYWNLSVVKKAMSQVVGYKEREFDSEYGVSINYEGDGHVTKASPKALFSIIRMALAQKKIVNTRNENATRYQKELLDTYHTYKENYDSQQITDIKQTWYQLTHNDYLYSETTYFWQIFINTIHQSLYKESLLKYVSESEYLTLLGNIDNISHLLPFYDMWDISRKIRKEEAQLNFWLENDIQTIANADIPEVRTLVKHYGYHSDKELDVTYPCYYEDATPLIATLKEMVTLEDSFGPHADKERGNRAYDNILQSVTSRYGSKTCQKLNTRIQKMRSMLWWREEFRDISTRFYYIIRVYTKLLAKELVAENILPEENDIWYLKVSTLWDYLDHKLSKEQLLDLLCRNKKYYHAYRNYMSENEIGCVFSDEGVCSPSDTTALIKGIGANNGIVCGTARVIESFDEIGRLEENDILVTRFTDTGWTSKFAILSGIVTEYGGILCHAAIVSREYGIPAIVSCTDVMKKIKDGQKIKIDGATGVVTPMEDSNDNR